jgi:acetolactate synthase small subunit
MVDVRINGKEMKDAVLKADQFEMRILEIVPDHLRVQVKESSGHPFNFVPRFLEMVYPDKVVAVKDSGIVAIGVGKTIEQNIVFQERIRIEPFLMADLRYARKKLATIVWE